MSFLQGKWASFEEMYSDLKDDPVFLQGIKTDVSKKISNLILEIENAKSSKDMFDCTCKLSSFFDNLEKDATHDIYKKTNVYVLVLNAVFHNTKFTDTIVKILGSGEKISDLKKDSKEREELIFVNTSILLAFFGIAIDHQSINEISIEFLRKNTTDLLKKIVKKSTYKIDFINLCFFLEKVSWDNGLYFNQNYESKFPVKLNDSFLFTNLKTSRAFAGVTLTSLIIRPAIERRFKSIVSGINDENHSIVDSLDSVYDISHQINEKIKHYYRNTPKDITGFFDIFIRPNERNLVFCFEKFCSDFQYQTPKKRFFEIILDKLKTTTVLKNELIKYTKENFRAFNIKIDNDDQWTNKIFLISIKSLSILDEIKNAQDSKWVIDVTMHELYQWVNDVHEVLNKYYIEDDWEKIKHLVNQENESIEWKSSFYTPLEQEFVDNESDAVIQKRIFEKIIKVILAMLNTDGGTLVVGVVENPEAVKRLDAKENFVQKNNVTFFDVSYEFKMQNKTLDHVRLQILESLRQITDNSADEFNNLIEFEPIILRNSEQVASIVKISIKKAEKHFFNVRKENSSVWISLTKRAQGRNVDVDVRKHI